MAKTTTQPRLHLVVPRVRTVRESALWVFAGLALILFVALGSYDPADPAFSVAGDARPVSNRIGPAGAWFADLAFMLFGRPAYLFPVMVLLLGWLPFALEPRSKSNIV